MELSAYRMLSTAMGRRVCAAVLLCAVVVIAQTAEVECTAVQITGPVPGARIEIFKAGRLLRLMAGDRMLREIPIGLGFNPVGDKLRQGDGATPEGRYRVCVKNPQSRYFLSLGLSYPNTADATRAAADGRIGERDLARITIAEQEGRRPPWDTPLGGEIFIHGRGASSDWTLGCVALDDEDMAELYRAVNVGTEVVIRP